MENSNASFVRAVQSGLGTIAPKVSISFGRYLMSVPVDCPTAPSWSDDEVEKLLRLIENGVPSRDIAHILNRDRADVEQKASFLGVSLRRVTASTLTCTADSAAASALVSFCPLQLRPPASA
jgi:hypothetical protein